MELSSVTNTDAYKENNSPSTVVINTTVTPEPAQTKPEPADLAIAPETENLNSIPAKNGEAHFGLLRNNIAPEWKDHYSLGQNIKLNYPHWFNITTVGLHALGGVLPSLPFIPKRISGAVRQGAIKFSQWCVPISKIQNCYEAIKGKRTYEAIARILPNIFLPFLPFHNFQLAYGLGSGINVVHEHIKSRVGDLKAEDGFEANNKKIQDGFFTAVKDLLRGGDHVTTRERSKLALTLGGGAAMILGAIPTLLFDRTGLNDGFARLFGSIRSIGGLLGDMSITLFPSHKDPELRKKEPVIGAFYLIPTIMDFAQRWMNQGDEANEIFNHVKTTLNTIAELIWTHFSTVENNKKELAKEQLSSRELHQAVAA